MFSKRRTGRAGSGSDDSDGEGGSSVAGPSTAKRARLDTSASGDLDTRLRSGPVRAKVDSSPAPVRSLSTTTSVSIDDDDDDGASANGSNGNAASLNTFQGLVSSFARNSTARSRLRPSAPVMAAQAPPRSSASVPGSASSRSRAGVATNLRGAPLTTPGPAPSAATPLASSSIPQELLDKAIQDVLQSSLAAASAKASGAQKSTPPSLGPATTFRQTLTSSLQTPPLAVLLDQAQPLGSYWPGRGAHTHGRVNAAHTVQLLSAFGGSRSTVSSLCSSVTTLFAERFGKYSIYKARQHFNRRVTVLEWHPSHPRTLACTSHGGDIALYRFDEDDFSVKIMGQGPGGSIQEMKFHPVFHDMVLTAAVEGSVIYRDLEGHHLNVLSTYGYERDFWFCSVDITPDGSLVAAGDNKGKAFFFDLRSSRSSSGTVPKTLEAPSQTLVTATKLHKQKIQHIEFHPLDPTKLATAGNDKMVCIWDIRMLSPTHDLGSDVSRRLASLPHDAPISSAHWSPASGAALGLGFRLLTTAHNEEIRVYRAGDVLSGQSMQPAVSIEHPHRFFQHMAAIKATWHPTLDVFVIGRYPNPSLVEQAESGAPGTDMEKTVDLFEGRTGRILQRIKDARLSGILNLNKFDRNGDYLASATGHTAVVWKQSDNTEIEYKDTGDGPGTDLLGRRRGSSQDRHDNGGDDDSGDEDDDGDANDRGGGKAKAFMKEVKRTHLRPVRKKG